MTKAYDVNELVGRFTGRGLGLAEDAAKAVIDEVFGWVYDSVKLSATPFDDVALVVLPKLKELALKEVDKIDGKVDL